MNFRPVVVFSGLALTVASLTAAAEESSLAYVRTDLVANRTGVAVAPASVLTIDPDLLNPWGIAFGNGPVWTSNNNSASSTLYNGVGARAGKFGTPTSPTGIISNTNSSAALLKYISPAFTTVATPSAPSVMKPAVVVNAAFVWSHEDGEISAWAGTQNNPAAAVTVVSADASRVYKGLGFATNGKLPFLYAADFKGGKIDVYFASTAAAVAAVPATASTPAAPAIPTATSFAPVPLDGSVLACNFSNPHLPKGYAPFNVEAVADDLVVTYALQADMNGNEMAGPGLGRAAVFTADGCLVRELEDRGALNAPWGIALAPVSFGRHGGALLIGNFGSGTISTFDLANGEYRGDLKDAKGTTITIDGLWGLSFGNGARFQPGNTLFYAAGPNGEADGLYGRIDAVKGAGSND